MQLTWQSNNVGVRQVEAQAQNDTTKYGTSCLIEKRKEKNIRLKKVILINIRGGGCDPKRNNFAQIFFFDFLSHDKERWHHLLKYLWTLEYLWKLITLSTKLQIWFLRKRIEFFEFPIRIKSMKLIIYDSILFFGEILLLKFCLRVNNKTYIIAKKERQRKKRNFIEFSIPYVGVLLPFYCRSFGDINEWHWFVRLFINLISWWLIFDLRFAIWFADIIIKNYV